LIFDLFTLLDDKALHNKTTSDCRYLPAHKIIM